MVPLFLGGLPRFLGSGFIPGEFVANYEISMTSSLSSIELFTICAFSTLVFDLDLVTTGDLLVLELEGT